jgi:hypothetical protein
VRCPPAIDHDGFEDKSRGEDVICGQKEKGLLSDCTRYLEGIAMFCSFGSLVKITGVFLVENLRNAEFQLLKKNSFGPITYYRTVSLILDHSYLIGKLTSSKIADTEVSGFQRF